MQNKFQRFIYLIFITTILLSCSSTITPTSTPVPPTSTFVAPTKPINVPFTPTNAPPTPTECPGEFSTTPSPDTAIHYMECSTARYQNDIDTAVQWAVVSLPNIELGNIEIYVFDKDFETLANLQNQSTRKLGFQTESLAQLQQNWGDGGGLAGPDGLVFIYFGSWWRRAEYSEQAKTIVHEIHHIAQYRKSSKKNFWASKLPVWWVEGFAEYYARTTIAENGVTPLNITPTLNQCEQSLAKLSEWSTLDSNCLYTQGSMAGQLFDKLFGENKYWEIWEGLSYNPFDFEFKKVTGFSVTQFAELFEIYKNNNYSEIPPLPAP